MPPIRPSTTSFLSSASSVSPSNRPLELPITVVQPDVCPRDLSPTPVARTSISTRSHPYSAIPSLRARRSSMENSNPLMTSAASCFLGPAFHPSVPQPEIAWSSSPSSSANNSPDLATDVPDLIHSATSSPDDFPSPARFETLAHPDHPHASSSRRLNWHDVTMLSEAFEYAREPPTGPGFHGEETEEDEDLGNGFDGSAWYPVDEYCQAGPSRSLTPLREPEVERRGSGSYRRDGQRVGRRRYDEEEEEVVRGRERDEHSASPRSRRTSKQKGSGMDVRGRSVEGLRLSSPKLSSSQIEGAYEPPKLPLCKLDIHFAESEQDVDIPPAFYAGAAIPTLLNLVIDRYTCLPHDLNPRLTMALTGTLHLGVQTRNIISVSVSLAEGLVLWSRDAVEAHKRDVPRELAPLCDPNEALPGGRYSLPLTVQIPNTKLPPTYDTPHGKFSVTYALSVVLTCDNPDPVKAAKGEVITLATVARPFHLLPVTMPDEAPQLENMAYWTRSEDSLLLAGVAGSPKFGSIKRLNARWMMLPSIPTTTYSPTSTIPVNLKFTSHSTNATTALIRLTIMQRQRVVTALPVPTDASSSSKDLVSETPVCSRFGLFELSGQNGVTELKGMGLPLMVGDSWKHGFSTKLVLPEDDVTGMPEVSVSNDLYVLVEVGFPNRPMDDFLRTHLHGHAIPAINTLSRPTQHPVLSRQSLAHSFPGKVKTTEIPLFIGSVSEPRDAMHWVRWSDLMVEQEWVDGERRERARMINGGTLSCENGWLVAPPSYEEAMNMDDAVRGAEWVDIVRS